MDVEDIRPPGVRAHAEIVPRDSVQSDYGTNRSSGLAGHPMTHEAAIGESSDHDPVWVRSVVFHGLVNHSEQVSHVIDISAEEAARASRVPALLTKPVLRSVRVEEEVLVFVDAVKEVHVLCVALAISTETVQRHHEWQGLRVVMPPGHPEERVPPRFPDRHIGMLVSVVRRSEAVIRATAETRAIELR